MPQPLEYLLPDYLACYLINGDKDGLKENEIKEIDEFLEVENIHIVSVNNDSGFYKTNDLNNIGCNCSTYVAYYN